MMAVKLGAEKVVAIEVRGWKWFTVGDKFEIIFKGVSYLYGLEGKRWRL